MAVSPPPFAIMLGKKLHSSIKSRCKELLLGRGKGDRSGQSSLSVRGSHGSCRSSTKIGHSAVPKMNTTLHHHDSPREAKLSYKSK